MSTPARQSPLALAALFLAAVLACQGAPAGDTAREISSNALASMALPLEDFGADFAGFQASEENGLRTLEQAAEDDFDPEDERGDLERFGYASGYQAFYSNPQAARERSGVSVVGSSVGLFETSEDAAGYFQDLKAESREQTGKTSKGVTAERVETFNAEIADDAAGAHGTFHIGADGEAGYRFWVSALALRHGRLVATVAIYSFEEQRFQGRLKALARQLDQHISNILAAQG